MTIPEDFPEPFETITVAKPLIQHVYRAVGSAICAVHSQTFMPPQAIYMHPLTWDWFLSILDTEDRPLFLPNHHAGFASHIDLATEDCQRSVGSMHGLPVLTDPYVSRDEILVVERDPHPATAVVVGLEIPA